MLISFIVENFLSFRERCEFTMVPGKARDLDDHVFRGQAIPVLKYAAIFGANASGKSNLIKAMEAARDIMMGLINEYAGHYYRVDGYGRDRDTSMEFTISVDGRNYAYGYSVNLHEGRMLKEWLYELFDDRDRFVVFERDGDRLSSAFENDGSSPDAARFDIYATDAMDNGSSILRQFFKKKIDATGPLRPLKTVFDWITRDLVIISTDSRVNRINVGNLDRIGEIMGSMGTGITKIELRKDSDSLVQFNPEAYYKGMTENMPTPSTEDSGFLLPGIRKRLLVYRLDNGQIDCKAIKYSHRGTEYDSTEESEGTDRLFDLVPILIPSDNKTYVIDELDRSLHPQVTRRLVELFIKANKGHDMQLMFTTHESRLMDLNLIRRDEIWLIEKESDGCSELFSLEDFKERNDRRVDRAYLDGRYGAVPLFNEIFPDLEDR